MKHRCRTCGKLKHCSEADLRKSAWCFEWRRRTNQEILNGCVSRVRGDMRSPKNVADSDSGI